MERIILSTSAMEEEPHRKRSQRVQLSCTLCRVAKLRCDRGTPCDQCLKRGREQDCSYTERGFRYNAAKHRAHMRQKLDRLESFVAQLEPSKLSYEVTVPNKDGENDRRADDVNNLREDLSQATGRLCLTDKGSTKYVGPSHWESIIEDIAEVKAYFDSQASPGEPRFDFTPTQMTTSPTLADIPFGHSKTYTLDELLNLLPTKPYLDVSVATWLNAPDTLRLITHQPTFQEEYVAFWSAPAITSPAWLALMLAVATVGSEIRRQNGKESGTLNQAEHLRKLTTHALVLADYAKPQLHIIETILLHIKYLLIVANDITFESHMLLGMVTRMCTQGGYHKDPRHNPKINPLLAEMRRRVWAAVKAYDIKMCYQLGMVSIINFVPQDTAPLSNYTDEDLLLSPLPSPRPMSDQTTATVSIVYNTLSSIYGDVIYSTHAVHQPNQNEVSGLYDRLQYAREQLPPQLQFKPLGESFMDAPDLLTGRYGMEMAHLKSVCILYQRFMGVAGYQSEQERCVKAAEGVLRLQIELFKAVQSGIFEAALVFLKQHIHDFNLAAMLLCLHEKHVRRKGCGEAGAIQLAELRSLILEGCHLWEALGTESTKARSARTAIQDFLSSLPVIAHGENAPALRQSNGVFMPTTALQDPPSELHVSPGNANLFLAEASMNGVSDDAWQQDAFMQELLGPGWGNVTYGSSIGWPEPSVQQMCDEALAPDTHNGSYG
ncbi:hypothetical protein BAUCODRAFT_151190 [Baudoinia panamericana UAMH 10762]|uniref:Zn(2)-C6 fungal-type domain-containing protein n=1 Tax=Baudoinia panamericana (strain UAMH 10762) TaxID=717646 RepID=M2MMW3_BAUPA|nr:uncharacterized protein BAUCODRAFT_151190 [Baudoinia panamericana UAMH 10762]EMC92783.1 hypothetical protein BAUCODRAFT_151190 [Baudoinia panamericana UAMH 10762]